MSKTTKRFSSEVRERAVRMVGEHRADYRLEWEAMVSIAGKTASQPKRCGAGAVARLAGVRDQRRWRMTTAPG